MVNKLRNVFDIRHSVVPRIVGTILILVLSSGLASAQESVGLVATIGSGKLTISGGGFRPNEHVALRVEGDQVSRYLTIDADSQGTFRLRTDTALEPGTNVLVSASGDHGTTKKVKVNVPQQLPPLGTPFNSVLLALFAGFAMLASGVAVMTKPQPVTAGRPQLELVPVAVSGSRAERTR